MLKKHQVLPPPHKPPRPGPTLAAAQTTYSSWKQTPKAGWATISFSCRRLRSSSACSAVLQGEEEEEEEEGCTLQAAGHDFCIPYLSVLLVVCLRATSAAGCSTATCGAWTKRSPLCTATRSRRSCTHSALPTSCYGQSRWGTGSESSRAHVCPHPTQPTASSTGLGRAVCTTPTSLPFSERPTQILLAMVCTPSTPHIKPLCTHPCLP